MITINRRVRRPLTICKADRISRSDAPYPMTINHNIYRYRRVRRPLTICKADRISGSDAPYQRTATIFLRTSVLTTKIFLDEPLYYTIVIMPLIHPPPR
jgi:hypothetical protein